MTFIVADRVKETSTTTGTGAMTLAGAAVGFSTFASRCAVGDTLYYAIQAVDNGGVPTGEWECGLGTYSAANTLTRTTVTSSSNADSAVSFSAGTKQVYITMPAVQVKWVRERLTAARTYYVATTGNDSNDGLTAGTPFLTIQKAANIATSTLDAGIHQVTVQIADGTYTGPTLCKPMTGNLPLLFQGNAVTPANVHVNVTGDCFAVDTAAAAIKVLNMKLTATGNCLSATPAGKIEFGNLVFGTASRHIYAAYSGYIGAISAYAIVGSAQAHILSSGGMVVSSGLTITLTGALTFSTAFVHANRLGLAVVLANTYAGAFTVTGLKFNVSSNATVDSNGGSGAYPGATAGVTATGGQCV